LAQLSPLVLFIVFYKRINKIIELRVIFLYVLISLISDFLLGVFKSNASLIISAFAICEYAFFSAFFFLCIQNKKFKTLIVVISALNLSIALFLFYSQKINFDFWAALVTAILIVIYSIFFFYEQVNSPQALIIYQSYIFWIVVGCIIYLSGTLFLFLYTSDVKDRQNSSLWIINVAFEIVKNVCFSIAFIIARNDNRNIATQNFNDTNIFEKPF
jgi:hypothetical protein